MGTEIWLALAAGFVVVYFVTPLVKKFAEHIGALDQPEERKVHSQAMPRLGGLAVYLGFTLIFLFVGPLTRPAVGILLGGAVIILLGIWDDLRGLSPRTKLVGQALAALVVVLFGIRVEFITNLFGGMIALGNLSIPFTLLWIIGVTNALNLIDGLDGLAAGTAVIASLTIAVVAWSGGQMFAVFAALLLAICVLGFLRYNFHPAQIFLGDSGSMFLGFNLAVIAVLGLTKGATAISLFVPVVILGIPILDTLLAIMRRFFQHQPIFQADKQHLHHRLLEIGFSHRQTVLVIYAVNLLLGLSAILLTIVSTDRAVVLLLLLATLSLWAADRLGMVWPSRFWAAINPFHRRREGKEYYRG